MRNLNALAIFAKVVEAKSFSAAARALKMPISTVSRRIAELEEQLGVRLLERSTRSLRVTDVGTEVLEHARHSAELCEAVDSIISNTLSDVSGTLRLCTPPSISDSLIVPVVSAFRASYPSVRVQVRVSERLVHRIEGDIDIAFRVGAFIDTSLVVRKLLTYRHQVVASPAYLAGRELPRTPRDLLDHHRVRVRRHGGAGEDSHRFAPWQPRFVRRASRALANDLEATRRISRVQRPAVHRRGGVRWLVADRAHLLGQRSAGGLGDRNRFGRERRDPRQHPRPRFLDRGQGHQRRQSPDAPPVFSTRRTASIVIPRSAAFSMS